MPPEMQLQEIDMLINDMIGRMAHSTSFAEWWDLSHRKDALGIERDMLVDNMQKFVKSMTKMQLAKVGGKIQRLQKKGMTSKQIIDALQKESGLRERWKAERVYWTEVKRMDTEKVADASADLDIVKFRAILSPSACKMCREKSSNGRKIFKSSDIEKAGYGHVPPFHPSCFCILVPEA